MHVCIRMVIFNEENFDELLNFLNEYQFYGTKPLRFTEVFILAIALHDYFLCS